MTSSFPPEVRERVLRESLAAWRAQGLLSAEQHDRLLASVAGPTATQRALAQERKLGRGVGSDRAQLAPMTQQLQGRYGQAPGELLVDGGFVNHDEILAVARPE